MKLACSKAGDKAAMCVERPCPELINKRPPPYVLMSLAEMPSQTRFRRHSAREACLPASAKQKVHAMTDTPCRRGRCVFGVVRWSGGGSRSVVLWWFAALGELT